jgi:hypothetical protein
MDEDDRRRPPAPWRPWPTDAVRNQGKLIRRRPER